MQSLVPSLSHPFLKWSGRVYPERGGERVWLNWTCSGLQCSFLGRKLEAAFFGIASEAFGLDLPYIGVTSGADPSRIRKICVRSGENRLTLFEAEGEGPHHVFIWKLSENARGKAAVSLLETDGTFLALPPAAPKINIEFIGDSITCGYGNEAADRDAPFKTEEENGLLAFCSQAAGLLGASFRCIAVSGISVAVNPQGFVFPGALGMEDLYPYTDRLYEEHMGITNYEPWDFVLNPADFIVINLGTNDVNAYKASGDLARARRFFQEHYLKFIETVRSLNGSAPHILCTLGPLDYYLYDEIMEVVRTYSAHSGDRKISSYKFGGVVQWEEGFGAVGHPSAKTHQRMGRELASVIHGLMAEGKET